MEIWLGSSQIFQTKEHQKLQQKCNANTTVAHPPQNAQDSHGKQTNIDTASHVSKSWIPESILSKNKYMQILTNICKLLVISIRPY